MSAVRDFGQVLEMRSGRTRWAIDFKVEGRRLRLYSDVGPDGERIAFRSRLDAERALARIQLRLERTGSAVRALAKHFPDLAPSASFGAVWTRYLERQEQRHQAHGRPGAEHLRNLRTVARCHLDPLRELPVEDVTYPVLHDWSLRLTAERGPYAAKRAVTAVMACLRDGVRFGELDAVPPRPEISIHEHLPALLTESDQLAICEAIEAERRGIFLAGCLMALRTREACDALAADYQGGLIRLARTKTRRVMTLPCPEPVEAWIEAHVPPAERRIPGRPLFVNPRALNDSRRWTRTALSDTWRAAQLEALGEIRAPLQESWRHSGATNWLRAGHSLSAVQAVLGHRHQSTTERYAKLAGDAAVAVLRPRK